MRQDCVLVLEPNVLIRHPLTEYLRECGYHVLEAASYDEARTLLESSRAVDAVLTNMATDGGAFAFANWVRQNHPSVVLLLGGNLAKVTELAGELCDEGPAPSGSAPHYSTILDRIRRALAARDRG
ncbi:response regulator [Bradyrhizobium sp. CCBAU 51753]|nr:response regulator [Bradyrhizobium sp. CCBAU 51753]